MKSTSDKATNPCAVFRSPPAAESSRGEQESLRSWIRRLAEFNHLALADVLKYYVLPIPGTGFALAFEGGATHLIDRGASLSRGIIEKLERVTLLAGLEDFTLQSLLAINGVAPIVASRYRKWCGICFNEDRHTEAGPFERLLWSINDVVVCPKHRFNLTSTCPSCGYSKIPALTVLEISGFCPKCRKWLGAESHENAEVPKDFHVWVAESFSQVLNHPDTHNLDASESIRRVLNEARNVFYDGNFSKFASDLGKNKSATHYWIHGLAMPQWNHLCEIAYALHISLLDLLCGRVHSLPPLSVQLMRTAIQARVATLSTIRKPFAPRRLDASGAIAAFSELRAGGHPHIISLAALSNYLKVDRSVLSKFISKHDPAFMEVLDDRLAALNKTKRDAHDTKLNEKILLIAHQFVKERESYTRRSAADKLRGEGLRLSYQEYPIAYRRIQECIAQILKQRPEQV
ncbi:TniQ family protein [Variovorax ginsengisoli]|uniref:TniQ family protein n=1 Tax=Variovorax ginsengisoli TaxID=363844 RepID=A0ABT8S7W0_9BURK|nr:TniQ family protein [Variovorax ginsengisoli]MDN8615685.1 TniQ family protein [Variovorax ginsengisoli]MDO1534855.1 TniQ family protein [Variovorax ginsengisoli]